MIFDKIFHFMLCELVGIVNFDDGKILEWYDLWVEWVLMLMMEWWSWGHTFGIMYELCLFVIKYNMSMF